MKCSICGPELDRSASLFVIIKQDDDIAHKARVCHSCLASIRKQSRRYPGLTIEFVSQQDFNEFKDPLWKEDAT